MERRSFLFAALGGLAAAAGVSAALTSAAEAAPVVSLGAVKAAQPAPQAEEAWHRRWHRPRRRVFIVRRRRRW